ncbi:hypothetical protein QUB80_12330 [Chlorogloeopsis sp. ULAP01]|uniref:hypothetical protein n=1 Tax=Chlorogloeopsis sp. ULAP01 TaxID=3056483 RepID=UPI0025AB164C|nr:hypothetical protein [Chlorogloeopsis sp. ULAP01]MDM9381488.1 hypothetical protein [Chlorogloeopsis sp. ULAP01]
MSFNNLLGQITSKETKLAQANLSVEQPNGEVLNRENLNVTSTPDPALIVAPIIFLAMAGVIVSHKLKLFHQFNRLNNLQQHSCQNCRYFSNNKYIKCAVNPTIALTEEAKNCLDYHPQNKIKPAWFSRFSNKKPN